MINLTIAPCGVICDICLAFQRSKNKCVGCNNFGNKLHHCSVCRIITCPEKNGNEKLLCVHRDVCLNCGSENKYFHLGKK